MRSGSMEARHANAIESRRTAGECIGEIVPGMSIFAITRGQWSMIDAVLYCIAEVPGPVRLSLWTWTIAQYEVECIDRLMRESKIESATLIIDIAARSKNADQCDSWAARFGDGTIRYCANHAKIATIESADGLKLLLRGSMNLNKNPRFEQFDLSEGGPGFDMIREIEEGLPLVDARGGRSAARAASGIDDIWEQGELAVFGGIKAWGK